MDPDVVRLGRARSERERLKALQKLIIALGWFGSVELLTKIFEQPQDGRVVAFASHKTAP